MASVYQISTNFKTYQETVIELPWSFFLGKLLHLVIFSTSTSGQSSGGAVHSPPGDYYGYCSLYQSMDKNTPVAALVYQNGQTSFTEPDYQNVQTLKGGIPYASVHSLGSQTESAYEPLRGSDMQNVYESLNEEGNWIVLTACALNEDIKAIVGLRLI